MFYKLSQEAFEKIRELIGKDSFDNLKPLYKIKDRKITDEKNYSVDDLNKIIQKFDLDKTNFIGQGLFSIVFEKNSEIYKFTMNRSDILKTILFKSIQDKLPEKYRKFIMEIYDFGYDEETKFYYIITEKLYNLQKIEMSLLKGNQSPIEQSFVASTLITDRLITSCLEHLKNNVKNISDEIDKIINIPSTKNVLMSNIIKQLDKTYFIEVKSTDPEDIKIKNISVNSKRFASEVAAEIALFLKLNFKVNIKLDDSMNLAKIIAKKYLDNVSLPRNYTQDNSKFDESRYGGELMEFLRYIKQNYNILFRDLHFGNIMKRANGDFVLSDVGFFQVK